MGSYNDDPSMHDVPREDIVFEPAHNEDGKVNPKLIELMKAPTVFDAYPNEFDDSRMALDGQKVEYFSRYVVCGYRGCNDEATKEVIQRWRVEIGSAADADYVVGVYCRTHSPIVLEWARRYNHAYVTKRNGICTRCGEVGSYIHTNPAER